MTLEDACQRLQLTTNLTDLAAVWQGVAQEMHPDHGGDGAVFALVIEVYKDHKRDLEEEAKRCGVCEGRGFQVVTKGWSRVRTMCEACGGTGQR